MKNEKKTKGRVAVSKRAMFQYKNWRIRRSDHSNLVIENLKTVEDPKTGESREEWQFAGYHSRFSGAIEALADKIGFNADTLQDAIDEIRQMRETIERMMRGRP